MGGLVVLVAWVSACGGAGPPLSSTDPVAYVLRGEADIAPPEGTPRLPDTHIEETIVAYFPSGTGEGAPVVVTHRLDWPVPGVARFDGVIEGGRVTGVALAGSAALQDFSLVGEIDLAAGCFVGEARRNVARPDTDIAMEGTGRIELCATSEVPPLPALSWIGMPASPLGDVTVAAAVPTDGLAFELTANGAPVTTTVEVVNGSFVIRPVAALPPGSEIDLTVAGVDVLGRSLVLTDASAALPVLGAVITDLTLDTEPPSGAISAPVWSAERGSVVVGASMIGYRLAASLAIGEPPSGATSVRVTSRASCIYGDVRAGVVAPDGAVSPIAVTCGPVGEPADVVVAIPGEGPLQLVLEVVPPTPRPQWLPPPMRDSFEVSAIAFE